jgi:predicted nucleotidyltransferase
VFCHLPLAAVGWVVVTVEGMSASSSLSSPSSVLPDAVAWAAADAARDRAVAWVPGEMLLVAVTGSCAHGLATAASDVDQVGVFAALPDAVLGLQSASTVSLSKAWSSPDVAVHELAKFCSGALQASPSLLEPLFCSSFPVLSDVGAELLELRSAFLSAEMVRSAFGGFAVSQMRTATARAASEDVAVRALAAKPARHAWRLLLAAERLLQSGVLLVDVAEFRDEVFAAGERTVEDPAAAQVVFDAKLAAFESVPSSLPDAPDVERVDRFVVSVRRRQMRDV